jgi:hypothetical protein
MEAPKSKKPQSLTINVTSSVTLDFDDWRGFAHTKATEYNEVEDYETALKAEWDKLLGETNGTLAAEADNDPEDDMIEYILQDYEYCAPDPPPKEKHYFKEPRSTTGTLPRNYALLKQRILVNPLTKQDLAVLLYNSIKTSETETVSSILDDIDSKVSEVYRDSSEDGYAVAEAE